MNKDLLQKRILNFSDNQKHLPIFEKIMKQLVYIIAVNAVAVAVH